MLGWYSTNETGGTDFVAKYLQDDHIFNWMQGDYGTYDTVTKTIDPDTYKLDHDPQTRYLYSDYSINNPYNSTITNEQNQKGGIKVKLQYDSTGKTVVAAKVAIDKNSQGTEAGTSKSYGLEVTARKVKMPKLVMGLQTSDVRMTLL